MKSLYWIILLVCCSNTFGAECLNFDEQKKQRKEVHSFILNSVGCESESDCKLVFLGCPFGCGKAVNIQSESEVKLASEKYHEESCSQCKYKCKHASAVKCVSKKCVEIY